MSASVLPASLTDLAFGFLLVFFRISSAIIVLPGFNEGSVPPMVKIGFALALTAIVTPLVAAYLPVMPSMPARAILLIAEQIAIGLTIGWVTGTILAALPMAGQAISYQIGLSSILLPSTDLGSNSTLVSSLFNLVVPVLFLSSALIAFPVIALVNSFHHIPADLTGEIAGHRIAASVVAVAIKSIAFEFLIATQIAAPFLVIGLIWQAGLGLMARASPQLQIFFVAAPLQIMVGLMLLALFLSPILTTWRSATSAILIRYMSF